MAGLELLGMILIFIFGMVGFSGISVMFMFLAGAMIDVKEMIA